MLDSTPGVVMEKIDDVGQVDKGLGTELSMQVRLSRWRDERKCKLGRLCDLISGILLLLQVGGWD